MIEKILGFMKEAGEIAIAAQERLELGATFDNKGAGIWDLVTEGDYEISKKFKAFVEREFAGLDYMVIDEESVKGSDDEGVNKVKNTEYALVIDPIDGTQTYALKLPLYGISVGVLRYGKPYLGAVYAPAIGELAYFDGVRAYWLQNAFKQNEKKVELVEKPFDPKALILTATWLTKINDKFDSSQYTINDFYSTVFSCLCMATGRARAKYVGVKIWDVAGAWPILKHLGFEVMKYNSGRVLEEVSAENFGGQLAV